MYSGKLSNPDIEWGRKMSLLVKCMQEWYILGVGNGVLFREVSSVQQCPYRVVPLYLSVLCIIVSEWNSSP